MTALDKETTESILAVHNSLWNALYDFDSDEHTLHYNDIKYNIYKAKHGGYTSVNLPNPKGTQFLWITQNLNKSTYGTQAIQRAATKHQDLRITWIVDTSNGQFTYRTSIHTTADASGNMLEGRIDLYDSLGTETIWSLNPALITTKAKF